MTDTKTATRRNGPPILWLVARYTALVVAAGVIAGLFVKPAPSLVLLLDLIVPLVPAMLLLHPGIWRNICPLATANTLMNRGNLPKPSPELARKLLNLGVVLFLVLVPARRFLFNERAAVLATTIAIMVVAAGVLGSVWGVKSGFCNAFCPVLPVERLYGFSPLVDIPNQRCLPRCTGCAPACIDIAPHRAPRQALGNGGKPWFLTAFGAFVLAFPGFVLGYFSISNVPLGEAVTVYLRIAAYSAGSLALFGVVAATARISFERMLPFLAAAGAGLYYWYSAPAFAAAFGGAATAGASLRVLTVGFVLSWLVVAVRRSFSVTPLPAMQSNVGG